MGLKGMASDKKNRKKLLPKRGGNSGPATCPKQVGGFEQKGESEAV